MLYTKVSNFDAANNEPKYPIYIVNYTDTPYTAQTRGYGVKYYDDPLAESSSGFDNQYLMVEGKDGILAYDWGTGVPPGISTNGYFKAKYFGYFYAAYTGDYIFYVTKEPTDYTALWIATGNYRASITDPSEASQYLNASTSLRKINEWGSNYKGFETSGVRITLTENTWYPMLLEYAQREKDSFIALRYLEPDGAVNSTTQYASDNDSAALYHNKAVAHKKVVCGYVFANEKTWPNYASASFTSSANLSGVTDISFNNNIGQSNILEFKVPLLTNVTTTSGLVGFRYNRSADLYYDDNTGTYLRLGRLIKVFYGYSSNGSSPNAEDYINKFAGIITDIKVDRSLKSNSLTITCQDFLYHTINSINENYPNKLSYALFDHTTNDVNGPNGVTRPVAYDSWPLVNVIRDLLYKAGIDAQYLYGRKKYNNSKGESVYGDYLIEDRNIYLTRRIKYGNCYAIGEDSETDDKYIWSNNFGDKLYDMLAKYADIYGFVLGANNYGQINFGSVNSPNMYIADTGWIIAGDEGNWKKVYDIKADGGQYMIATGSSLATNNVELQKYITGSWFVVNMLKKNSDQIGAAQHGWSIPYNEYPNNYAEYDISRHIRTAIQTNSTFGILYGRQPLITDRIVGYELVDATIYVRPTLNIRVTDIEYSSYIDEAAYFPNTTDTLCYADIYFGRVSDSNPRDLITSSLVFSNYKRQNRRVNLRETIHLNTPVTMTAGNIYGFRFVTKHSSMPNTDELAGGSVYYTYQNTYIPNYTTKFNAAYTTRRIDLNGNDMGGYAFYLDSGFNYGVFGNFAFIGETAGGGNTDYTKINVYRWNGSTYTFITGWTVDNVYYARSGFSSERYFRYPGDGRDFAGSTPCKFYIYGNDIGVNISGTSLSYDKYIINIQASGTSVSGTAITSIESYDTDFYSPKWEFNTSKNLTSLGFTQTLDDIRNDVIVVGDLIGEFRDYTTNEVINKNNPSLQYIYSRAIDISSINDPNSLNNVGRKRPFIIYEPTIVDQKHCDWMADALLYRYNTFKKVPSWQSYGVPFIENYDNVYIVDKYAGGMVNNSMNGFNQWIVSMSETINNKNYSMSIQTTPYLPWSTYVPAPSPDLNGFGNLPFINIKMVDSNNKYRGYNGVDDGRRYDVYESEISGNRLKVVYDQVIDGDIIIKVVSKNIMGFPAEVNVAYLVGHLKDGEEIPEYRSWGTDYELYWDGIDKLGSARRKIGQICSISGSSSSVTINNVDFVSSYDQPGFFAPSGEYFLRFMIFPRDRSLPNKSVDTTNLNRIYNEYAATKLGISSTSDSFEQLWKISWGDPLNIYMSVSGNTNGTNRNITYPPNNYFYTGENTDQGIKFTFFSTDTSLTCNRTLYYKCNLHHIYGLGYTFVLRNDATNPAFYSNYFKYNSDNTLNWKSAFERTALGWRKYKLGYRDDILISSIDSSLYDSPSSSIAVNSWPHAAMIPNSFGIPGGFSDLASYLRYGITEIENGAPYWNDGNQPQILDDFYTIISSGGRYRVVNWLGTPYTNYSVEDFIPSRTHKYSPINPISFYFDPTKNNVGAWDFFSLPDMKNETYYNLTKHLALASWFAGAETGWQNRLTFIVSHAFQIEVGVWDGTGRLLKNNSQLVDIGPKYHDHGIWDWQYTELEPNNATFTNHKHGPDATIDPPRGADANPHTKTITMHPAIAQNTDDNEAGTYYDLWGSYGIKHSFNMPSMYVSGADFTADNTYNYGIGYCNLSGSTMYGYWTWHGYWLASSIYDYMKLNNNIPAAFCDFAIAKHWIKYPHPLDHGLLGSSLILQVDNSWSFNDGTMLHTSDPEFDLNIYATCKVPKDPNTPSPYVGNLYPLISRTLSGWAKYHHAHLPVYESHTMNGEGIYSIMYGVDSQRINLSPIQYNLAGQYSDIQLEIIGNIEQELRFSSYSASTQHTQLQPVWYRTPVNLPWIDVTGGFNWWKKFLVESGLSFPYGGWSSNMVDKNS